MADAPDVEPTDKRTSEWKAWKARQVQTVEVQVTPSPQRTRPDPNVFFAQFLCGLIKGGLDKDIARAQAKMGWELHCELVNWVVSGEADEYVRAQEKQREDEIARVAEQRRKDAEAEKAQRQKDREQMARERGVPVESIAWVG